MVTAVVAERSAEKEIIIGVQEIMEIILRDPQ